ncbi:toprim domain-containing protein [Ornithobacterium rhinotracheale]|uniref:toprim domain-containing protein n=1 Tax=Ornithobacterium rhinotracheale TaxID=28251 RepID=UPI001FB8C747|nr:toprim domain-containing protein [Ornithobacterium rhinotracheale]UOH78912.1 toprim domain-containing protein [Ornithobacterium rhinotracheale]
MFKKEDILSKTNNGLEVFRHYVSGNWKVGQNFKNPFYDDKNPSCNIYKDKKTGIYRIKDFGDPRFNGDCFSLVGYLYDLDCKQSHDFVEILKIINRDLSLGLETYEPNISKRAQREIRTETSPARAEEASGYRPYTIIEKDFSEKEIRYWKTFGITKTVLDAFGVKSLQSFESINKKGQPYRIASNDNEPIFSYQNAELIKIYRPFSKHRFLYAGIATDYCFGLEQLLLEGDDILFITGGEKDVMSLYAKGFSAICFNSENSHIPISLIQSLKGRFRHIVLLYDVDHAGKKAVQSHLEKLKDQVEVLELPLSGTKDNKDISNYFQQGHTAKDLKTLFLKMLQKKYKQGLSLLQSCEIQWHQPPAKQKTIIALREAAIGLQSSLLGVTGGEGTGKSHYVAAMIAGSLYQGNHAIDLLGLNVTYCDNHAVLFFDTEQSADQLYDNISILLKRAQLGAMPSNFKAYCLTQIPRKERMKIIRQCMDTLYYEYSGIHLVVIDGIADLISSANNESESIEMIEELYALAGHYQTCMVCVLHLTPGGLKLRGHLGSELQRKASAVLSVEQDRSSACSVVLPKKIRKGDPNQLPKILFRWDAKSGMHRYCGTQRKIEKKDKTTELATLVSPLFRKRAVWEYSELVQEIRALTGVQERTAKNYIVKLKAKELLIVDSQNPQQLSIGKLMKKILNQK